MCQRLCAVFVEKKWRPCCNCILKIPGYKRRLDELGQLLFDKIQSAAMKPRKLRIEEPRKRRLRRVWNTTALEEHVPHSMHSKEGPGTGVSWTFLDYVHLFLWRYSLPVQFSRCEGLGRDLLKTRALRSFHLNYLLGFGLQGLRNQQLSKTQASASFLTHGDIVSPRIFFIYHAGHESMNPLLQLPNIPEHQWQPEGPKFPGNISTCGPCRL